MRIGTTATANNTDDIALLGDVLDSGLGSTVNSIAIGADSRTEESNATAVGHAAVVTGNASTAVGNNCTALGDFAVAMGSSANAGANSCSMGFNTQATGNFSAAVGYSCSASNTLAFSFGNVCNASASRAVAIGATASAQGSDSVAIGANPNAAGSGSTSIGVNALASGANSLTVGTQGAATGTGSSISIGTNSDAVDGGLAVGFNAQGVALQSIAVGSNATASAVNSTAVGTLSSATQARASSVGYQVDSQQPDSFNHIGHRHHRLTVDSNATSVPLTAFSFTANDQTLAGDIYVRAYDLANTTNTAVWSFRDVAAFRTTGLTLATNAGIKSRLIATGTAITSNWDVNLQFGANDLAVQVTGGGVPVRWTVSCVFYAID